MEYGALSKNCLLRLAYTSSAHFDTQVVYNILSPAPMNFNICIEHLVVPVKLRLNWNCYKSCTVYLHCSTIWKAQQLLVHWLTTAALDTDKSNVGYWSIIVMCMWNIEYTCVHSITLYCMYHHQITVYNTWIFLLSRPRFKKLIRPAASSTIVSSPENEHYEVSRQCRFSLIHPKKTKRYFIGKCHKDSVLIFFLLFITVQIQKRAQPSPAR